MSAPVKPADFSAVIPSPQGSMCQGFVKALLRLPVLIARFIAWMLDSDGNFTTAFKTMILAFTSPTGTIVFSGCTLTADYFLLCDGSTYSTTGTYAALFAKIQYTFGGSAGSFKVPNFTGRFPGGNGGTLGVVGTSGGSSSVSIAAANIPPHTHYIPLSAAADASGNEGAVVPPTTSTGAFNVDVHFANNAEASAGLTGPVVGDTTAPTATSLSLPLPPYLAVYAYIRI